MGEDGSTTKCNGCVIHPGSTVAAVQDIPQSSTLHYGTQAIYGENLYAAPSPDANKHHGLLDTAGACPLKTFMECHWGLRNTCLS